MKSALWLITTLLVQINIIECQNCLFDKLICKESFSRVQCNEENRVEEFPCINSKLNMNLWSMNIHGNNFKHIPSRIFSGLFVTRLNLSLNNIDSIADDAFEEISVELQSLSLEFN